MRARSVAKYQAKQKLKPRKPIRKRSIKRAKQERVYEKNKAEFFTTIEHCQFPNCEVVNVQLHHLAGRISDRLTDQSNFVALCHIHHLWAHENDSEARAMGLLIQRT